MKTFKYIKLVYIILAVAGLSTSLTSCQKSEVSNNSSDGINTSISNVTFGATINPPTTKGELNGLIFKWSAGDQLQVYYGETGTSSLSSTNFNIVEKETTYTNTETFTGSVANWDSAFDFYMVYPVSTIDYNSETALPGTSSYDSSTTTLKLTLPSNQAQHQTSAGVDPKQTEKYDYKLGIINNKEQTDNLANTTLTNLMTLIDVNITKPAEEMHIEKVVIRSNNNLFPTEYNYNVSTSIGEYENNTNTFSLYLLDDSSDSYTSLSSETSLQARFLMCPFSVASSDGFYIDVYTADKLYTLNKTGLNMTFAAGTRYSTSITLGDDTEVLAKTVTTTANSYIVAPTSALNMPVNVRGNGGDVSGTGLSTSISPVSVGVLWETSPDLISLSEISNDNKISVLTSSESGNAVIAAYNGADQTGDILWSWHIWVTDYDPDTPSNGTTYTILNSEDSSYTFMDRNLGATTAEPGFVTSFGLSYQWGRKDPFPTSASISDDIEPTIYDASGAGSDNMVVKELVSAASNLSNAIQNPLTYYYGATVVAEDESFTTYDDWYSSTPGTHNSALWGGASRVAPTAKTIFDPCPAGWRVPVWKATASPWSAFTLENFAWTTTGNYGRTYTDGAFYPAEGYRENDSGILSKASARGHYWTGTYVAEAAYILSFNRSNVTTSSRADLANDASVRCVKE